MKAVGWHIITTVPRLMSFVVVLRVKEGGGRLRRFAAEGSAEFILRLRQRLTAAKVL